MNSDQLIETIKNISDPAVAADLLISYYRQQGVLDGNILFTIKNSFLIGANWCVDVQPTKYEVIVSMIELMGEA